MGTRVSARRTATRNRIFAVVAAGAVVAGGVTVGSLAAWTDIEYVVGGVDADAGVTSSVFEVEQFTASDIAFDHYETEVGANVVDFGALAATLTPGDTVYGYVRLRTVIDSLGGTLTLAADTTVVADELSDALTYSAVLVSDYSDCNATDVGPSTTATLVPAGTALDEVDDPAATFSLAASNGVAPGDEQAVCFVIDFDASYADDDELQGQTVSPVWHFDAVSIAP